MTWVVLLPWCTVSDYRLVAERSKIPYLYEIRSTGINGACPIVLTVPRRSMTPCATNWRAEQALRPAIVTRKMAGGGHRSLRGAATQQVLASVLRTAHLRDLDAVPLFVDLLRAPTPTVSAALQAPRQ